MLIKISDHECLMTSDDKQLLLTVDIVALGRWIFEDRNVVMTQNNL
jgi:hypothetical protein